MITIFIGPSPGYPLNAIARLHISHFVKAPGGCDDANFNLAEWGLWQISRFLYGVKVAFGDFGYRGISTAPRESPAIKIIEELANLGADVRVYDLLAPSLAMKAGISTSMRALTVILRALGR